MGSKPSVEANVPRSRRRQAASLVAVGMVLTVVSACGGSSTPANTSASKNTGQTTSAAPAVVNDLFGQLAKSKADGSKTIKVGASLLLGGAYANIGTPMLNGLRLAAKEIKQAGGPTFDLQVENTGLDPTQGVSAMRTFQSKGIGINIASGSADLGSQLPLAAQDHILTLDPPSGIGGFPGKPYYWSPRGNIPYGPWPGVMQYVKQKLPNAKKVVLVSGDGGPTLNAYYSDQAKKATEAAGLQYLGAQLYGQGGQTDYSTTITRVSGEHPDVILFSGFSNDPATFMKQYVTSGGTAQVIGADFSPEAASVAGSAYDHYWFAQDAFVATAPANAWAKHFVDAYKAAYNSEPTEFAADMYESLFILWQLEADVLGKGQSAEDGKALQSAIEDNLDRSYPSVFGVGDKAGSLKFDGKTHGVSERGMGLWKVTNGQPSPLAYFGVDGSDLKVVG